MRREEFISGANQLTAALNSTNLPTYLAAASAKEDVGHRLLGAFQEYWRRTDAFNRAAILLERAYRLEALRDLEFVTGLLAGEEQTRGAARRLVGYARDA